MPSTSPVLYTAVALERSLLTHMESLSEIGSPVMRDQRHVAYFQRHQSVCGNILFTGPHSATGGPLDSSSF